MMPFFANDFSFEIVETAVDYQILNVFKSRTIAREADQAINNNKGYYVDLNFFLPI